MARAPACRVVAVLMTCVIALLQAGCGSRIVQESPAALSVVRADGSLLTHRPYPGVREQALESAFEAPEEVPPAAIAPDPPAAALATPAPVLSGESPRPDPACDWQENLDRATAGRDAEWLVLDTGAWGRAEVPGRRIWVSPKTPCDKVYSVAAHEWTHHMQGIVYGDWGVVLRELAPFGGPEVVADCGALLLGATWINYGCPDGLSSDAAAAVLRGEPVGQ